MQQVCQADYDADGNVTGYSPGVITVDGEAYNPDEEYRRVLLARLDSANCVSSWGQPVRVSGWPS